MVLELTVHKCRISVSYVTYCSIKHVLMVKLFGVFAKSQKVPSTFVIPDCPFIRLELGSIRLDFHEI